MKRRNAVLLATAMLAGLVGLGQALEQETKDKINEAAEPVQEGAAKAAGAAASMRHTSLKSQ